MARIRIGIVGVGKIARDQHIPALRGNPRFEFAACASRGATVEGVANFPSIEAMLAGCPSLGAISICTPPQAHFAAARLALEHGKDVFLEKPPCATTAELEQLTTLAQARGLTLFQSWHSRHAAAVEPARLWLDGKTIRAIRIVWKEDARQWHPGQAWIWQAGGFGIFDPGINALSILTEIVGEPIRVTRAAFEVPENCAAPIAAEIALETGSGAPVTASMDFRQSGEQSWDIDVETDAGTLKLSEGGARLSLDGAPLSVPAHDGEYPSLYRRFAQLVESRGFEVDASPFQLVADAFLVASHIRVPRFEG